MAYRITEHRLADHPFARQRTPSAEDLRCVFETAVCEIHRADMTTEKRLQHRAPIVPRARLLGLSQAGVEKQALSAAARALARLWKV
jgi:hypothetical protein